MIQTVSFRRVWIPSSMGMVAVAALACALHAAPARAADDSCEVSLTVAVAQLAQCRYAAEASFAKTENAARRDASFTYCAERFHESYERALQTWGATCPDTVSPSTFDDYVAQTSSASIAAAAGGSLATFPDVCTQATGTTLVITNNCSSTMNVTVATGNSGQANPTCLQGITANGGTATAYLPPNNNYAFWTGSYGSSSLFELNVAPGGAGTDNFDISFNQGFDIGMTVVAAPGGLVPYVIATDATAPGAYQLPANQPSCADAPCLSPNYNATTGGQWNLYLCNRANDVNTPGPCGCTVCPCSTSRGGPGCNWQTVTCMGLPNPGVNGCPATCPNS